MTAARNVHALATDIVAFTCSSQATLSSSTPRSCAKVIISKTFESCSMILTNTTGNKFNYDLNPRNEEISLDLPLRCRRKEWTDGRCPARCVADGLVWVFQEQMEEPSILVFDIFRHVFGFGMICIYKRKQSEKGLQKRFRTADSNTINFYSFRHIKSRWYICMLYRDGYLYHLTELHQQTRTGYSFYYDGLKEKARYWIIGNQQQNIQVDDHRPRFFNVSILTDER